MFRNVSKILLGSVLSLLLFSCNSEDKIKEFENLMNNKDYEFASNLYKENNDNEKFIDEVNVLISEKIDEYENLISDENISDVKSFVNFAAEFTNSNKINDINEKLRKIEGDKLIFEQGKKQINEGSYYSGILILKQIEEESEYYKKATEIIDENLYKARDEKIDISKRFLEEKSYEIAILTLEDINRIIDKEDIELNNLIEEYKIIKNISSTSDEIYNDKYSNIIYNNYYNTRFGYSIDYPSFLIEQPAPSNNDGRVFESENGEISLTVYAGYNVAFETREEIFNNNISELNNIYYTNLSEKSYEISWIEENSMYYKYGMIEDSLTYTFILKYPVSDSNVFKDIIQRCYESFKKPNKLN